MDSLTEYYDTLLVPLDAELEKQAAELEKQAAEENYCGRFMARGFADELNKIAEGIIPMPKGETVKVKTPSLAVGKPKAPGGDWGMSSRKIIPPPVKDISKGKGSFKPGSTVGGSGDIKPPKPVAPTGQ